MLSDEVCRWRKDINTRINGKSECMSNHRRDTHAPFNPSRASTPRVPLPTTLRASLPGPASPAFRKVHVKRPLRQAANAGKAGTAAAAVYSKKANQQERRMQSRGTFPCCKSGKPGRARIRVVLAVAVVVVVVIKERNCRRVGRGSGGLRRARTARRGGRGSRRLRPVVYS
jgi:hypothetical protein